MIQEIIISHDNMKLPDDPDNLSVHMFKCVMNNVINLEDVQTIHYPVQMTETSSMDISYFYLLVLLKLFIDYIPLSNQQRIIIKMHNFHACNIARDYIYKWKANQWYDSKGVLNPHSKLLNQLWNLFQNYKNITIKYPGGKSKT